MNGVLWFFATVAVIVIILAVANVYGWNDENEGEKG